MPMVVTLWIEVSGRLGSTRGERKREERRDGKKPLSSSSQGVKGKEGRRRTRTRKRRRRRGDIQQTAHKHHHNTNSPPQAQITFPQLANRQAKHNNIKKDIHRRRSPSSCVGIHTIVALLLSNRLVSVSIHPSSPDVPHWRALKDCGRAGNHNEDNGCNECGNARPPKGSGGEDAEVEEENGYLC